MNNPADLISNFIFGAKQRYGENLNPETTAKNMLGQNVNTPQEALDLMLKSGRINQQQYELYSKML